MDNIKDVLLHELEKELLRIKKISLREFGISLVDENLLKAVKEATQGAET